jgi:hypothetical protein
MILPIPHPRVGAEVASDEPAVGVTCPMCHTPSAVIQSAIDAGAGWRCIRCGQRWDATRLLAVSAYAAWVADRAAGQRGLPSARAPISQRDVRT